MNSKDKKNNKLAKIIIPIIILLCTTSIFLLLILNFIRNAGNTIKPEEITSIIARLNEKLYSTNEKLNTQLILKNKVSLLTGEFLSDEEYKNLENHRPTTIMVENFPDARPQAGLTDADIVYETLAEGGITRYMGVFWQKSPKEIGPVRSTRVYFLDLNAEYDSVHYHIGQATADPEVPESSKIDALGYLIKQGVRNTDCGFYRDQARLSQGIATEHTAFMTIEKMRTCMPQTWDGKSNVNPWQFKEDLPLDERSVTSEVTIELANSSQEYSSKWVYNRESNTYRRFINNSPDNDKNNSKQIEVKNLIIQYTKAQQISDEKNHMYFDIIGSGNATFVLNGQIINGTWKKDNAASRTKYFDATGAEMKFNRGQFWITIAPVDNQGKSNNKIETL